MKTVALLVAALAPLLSAAQLASPTQPAPAEGDSRVETSADYFRRDFRAALAESEVSGKPVFLDAYTTWCKPCRQMDARVFSAPEVAAMLEARFVPLRIDMEAGEGPALAERFGVAAYPTLLVLDAGGEVHRATGYHSAADLAAFADASADPGRNHRGLRARYAGGARDTGLLDALERIAAAADAPERERYAYDYLLATGDWSSEAAGERLLRAPQTTTTPLFDSLVARREPLGRQFSAAVVAERIDRLVDVALFPGEGLAAKPRDAGRVLRRAYGPRADSAYHRFRMRRAREAGKAKAFGRWAVRAQGRYPSDDPEELDELVFIFESRLAGWKPTVVDAWRARAAALREERGY